MSRILVDVTSALDDEVPSTGLVELVGGHSASRLASLEGAVLDASLRALMAVFELRALAIAVGNSEDHVAEDPLVHAVMPPGWTTDDGPGAHLHRQLHALLRPPSVIGEPWREIAIRGQRLWLDREVDGERVLAAAAARETPMTPTESTALGSAVRALAASVAERGIDAGLRRAIQQSTQIALKSEGDDVLAEVNADWPLPRPVRNGMRDRRTGVGRGAEPVLAVARAAAKASRPRCEVVFAGTAPACSGVDAGGTGPVGDVAIALVRHHDRGLRFGWAERGRGDLGAVAEAVFTAGM